MRRWWRVMSFFKSCCKTPAETLFFFSLHHRPHGVFSILKWLLMSWCNWRRTRSWLHYITFQHSSHSVCAAFDNNGDSEGRRCSGNKLLKHPPPRFKDLAFFLSNNAIVISQMHFTNILKTGCFLCKPVMRPADATPQGNQKVATLGFQTMF